MRLSQLEYFAAAVRYGSINAAARALHISQPAVSTAIRNLEKELGVSLFARRGQHLELSEAGVLFYPRVQAVLEELDQAAAEVRDFVPDTRVVRFGMPPMIGLLYLPLILEKFIPAHPSVHVELKEADTREIRSLLDQEKLDLAVMILESPYSRGLATNALMHTSYSFFVGPKDPLARAEKVTAAQLAKEPLLLYDTGLFLNQYLTDALASRGLGKPKIRFAGSQINSIKTYVEMSLGGTFLIRPCVRPGDQLVEVATEITPSITLASASLRGKSLSPAARALEKFLAKESVSLSASV